ncbi:hypothetical protein AKJ49_01865 [candidate division MSBL1 archaeon SCGC-AAA382A03]|uniref:Leucine-binding protein domain-containing protein n=1 Tax=candidate division MSBL1 archaeon SCGC-AAA382A03 TaxID=1698278 RepID=A0A133VDW7_9EURY|nr:hypothetical protein AKJ49_01865 [candidate division MSBL1 archaeon SCGC-AAA382A03]
MKEKGQGTTLEYILIVLVVISIIISGVSLATGPKNVASENDVQKLEDKISSLESLIRAENIGTEGQENQVTEKAPITLGAAIPKSGKYESAGTKMLQGYKFARDIINEEFGGIEGRRVQILAYDSESDPATGVKLYRKLIHQDEADLLLAACTSAMTKAVTPVVEEAGYPLITTWAYDSAIWENQSLDYVVQGGIPTPTFSRPIFKYASEQGIESCAIVYEDTAYPAGMARGGKQWAKEYGLEVKLHQSFPKDVTDYKPLTRKAKKTEAPLFVAFGYYPDAVGFTKAMDAVGYNPKYWAQTDGAFQPEFKEAVGDLCRGTMTYGVWNPKLKADGILMSNSEFVSRWEEKYGEKPAWAHQAGFLAISMLYKAASETIKSQGELDLDWMNDYIHTTEFQTIEGKLSFKESGPNKGLQDAGMTFLSQWQGGERYIVYPSELAQRETKVYQYEK